MRKEGVLARLAGALLVVAGCAGPASNAPLPAVRPDTEPAYSRPADVIPPSMTWTAELVREPLMIESHVRGFREAGGTLRPQRVGLTFKPCKEAGQRRARFFLYDEGGRLVEEAIDALIPESVPRDGLGYPVAGYAAYLRRGTHFRYEEDRLVTVAHWQAYGPRLEDPTQSFAFHYDASGRLSRVTLDETNAGTTEYAIEYDHEGRLALIRQLDAKAPRREAARLRFEYDEQDRLVARRWSDRSGGVRSHVFAYRSDGNLERFETSFSLRGGLNSKRRFRLRYDRAGRYIGNAGVSRYGEVRTYDSRGRPAGFKYRGGSQDFRYTYGECRQ